MIKTLYALLISSQMERDYEKERGFNRNDDIYINMLTDKDFYIPINTELIPYYKKKGFDIGTKWGGETYLHLSWSNYRKLCTC